MRGRTGWPIGLALCGILAAGCAALGGLEGEAPIRAVALRPLLDRPADLTVLHSPTPLDEYGDTVSAVLVRFEGRRLALRTGSLSEAPAYRGTLREFLRRTPMPLSFRLYEVRGAGGRTLGFLLAREKGLTDFFLDEDEALVANATPVRDATP